MKAIGLVLGVFSCLACIESPVGARHVLAAQQEAKPTLVVGSPAPAFKPEHWLKGESFESFKPGHVYIVEFWATWCAPCRRAIPHLTKLQAKHPKTLTVIGHATADRQQKIDDAREFVEQQDTRMAYTVTFSPRNKTYLDWNRAAGRRTIPSAYVVNGEGKIAYIGRPDKAMDDAVEAAIADLPRLAREAADARAEAYVAARQEEREARRDAKLQARIDEAAELANRLLAEGEDQRAVAVVDAILALDAKGEHRWASRKIELMVVTEKDDRYVLAEARRMADREYAEHAGGLSQLCKAIDLLEARTPKPEIPDALREIASSAIVQASELSSQANPEIEELLAGDLWRRGEKQAAIEAQRRAVVATPAQDDRREQRQAKLKAYTSG